MDRSTNYHQMNAWICNIRCLSSTSHPIKMLVNLLTSLLQNADMELSSQLVLEITINSNKTKLTVTSLYYLTLTRRKRKTTRVQLEKSPHKMN